MAKSISRYLRSGGRVIVVQGSGGVADELVRVLPKADAALLHGEGPSGPRPSLSLDPLHPTANGRRERATGLFNSPGASLRIAAQPATLADESPPGTDAGALSCMWDEVLADCPLESILVLDPSLDARTLISSIEAWSRRPIACFEHAEPCEPDATPSMADALSLSTDLLYSGTAKTGSGKIFNFAVASPAATSISSLVNYVQHQWRISPDLVVHFRGDEWPEQACAASALHPECSAPLAQETLRQLALALKRIPSALVLSSGLQRSAADGFKCAARVGLAARTRLPSLGVCSYRSLDHAEVFLGAKGEQVSYPRRRARNAALHHGRRCACCCCTPRRPM